MARKPAAAPAPDPRLDKGLPLLILAQAIAQATPEDAEHEKVFLHGFFNGFEHALQLASTSPEGAERWRAFLRDVLHKGRPEPADLLQINARVLASWEPST